jgi:hypothetical protein
MNGIYLGTGIFLLVVTYYKPHWFWETPSARRLRHRIGDQATTVFCYSLAVVLIVLSIFSSPQ